MRGNDVFPSKSLKAEDIKGKNPVVVIDRIEMKTFQDDNTTKPVIHFTSISGQPLGKSLVCNRTNWNAIVDITGEDDSDRWAGKRIMLIVSRVDFQGRRVDAIRVEAPENKPLSSRTAHGTRAPREPEPEPVYQREPGDDEEPPLTDSDIPF